MLQVFPTAFRSILIVQTKFIGDYGTRSYGLVYEIA